MKLKKLLYTYYAGKVRAIEQPAPCFLDTGRTFLKEFSINVAGYTSALCLIIIFMFSGGKPHMLEHNINYVVATRDVQHSFHVTISRIRNYLKKEKK